MVTMSCNRDWLDRVADANEMAEGEAISPISLPVMILDVIGELKQENIGPQIWNAINEICALVGEKNAPTNPKMCEYCRPANDHEREQCSAYGAALPVDLPRSCPKCGRAHLRCAVLPRRTEPNWS